MACRLVGVKPYLNQCRNIVFIHENPFQSVVWKIAAILSQPIVDEHGHCWFRRWLQISKFSGISIEIPQLSLEKMYFKVSCYKWRLFCPGPSVSNGRAVWKGGQSDIDIQPIQSAKFIIPQRTSAVSHNAPVPFALASMCKMAVVWKGQRDTDISVDGIDHIHNPAMHQYHIPQSTIL